MKPCPAGAPRTRFSTRIQFSGALDRRLAPEPAGGGAPCQPSLSSHLCHSALSLPTANTSIRAPDRSTGLLGASVGASATNRRCAPRPPQLPGPADLSCESKAHTTGLLTNGITTGGVLRLTTWDPLSSFGRVLATSTASRSRHRRRSSTPRNPLRERRPRLPRVCVSPPVGRQRLKPRADRRQADCQTGAVPGAKLAI